MIVREKEHYIVKDLWKINLTRNCIYLNNKVEYIVVPFYFAGFLFHIILNNGNDFSLLLNQLSLIDTNFFFNWSKKGTIVLDLEMNEEYILNQIDESLNEYLHPRKKEKLYTEKLYKNIAIISQRNIDPYIYIGYSLKTVILAKNISYRGVWLDVVPKDELKKQEINTFIENIKNEMKVKQKNVSIFNTIKTQKELRRKSNISFKDNFLSKLKGSYRYQQLVAIYWEENIHNRIREELKIILQDGFGDYFSDYKLITDYLKTKNIIFHLKGSGVWSLILYIMNINNINPLRYNISFSRFLWNWKIADIDIDVPSAKREDILKDLEIIFKKQKNKDLYYIINTSSKNFNKLTLHPTGILLEDENIKNEIPLLKDNNKNISQFFDSSSNPILEDTGYLKYDLISSIVLSEIQEKLKNVDIKLFLRDWEKYILWDPTFPKELLESDFDYFQLNATNIKNILKEFIPSSYEDLCKMVAINRPAILRRYKKHEIINNLKAWRTFVCKDPHITQIIQDSGTWSMMIYQDQALNLLSYILPETNLKERLNLVKGRGDLKKYEKIFIDKCEYLLWDRNLSIYLWNGIKAFWNYGLNKAHAFSYGFIPLLQLYANKKK